MARVARDETVLCGFRTLQEMCHEVTVVCTVYKVTHGSSRCACGRAGAGAGEKAVAGTGAGTGIGPCCISLQLGK